MSAYYIERNNMSGNGGMDQSQQKGGQQADDRSSGMQQSKAPLQNGQPNSGMNGRSADDRSSSDDRSGSLTTQPQNAGLGSQEASTERDYRDDLRELLDKAHAERGLTRYRLCKQMGIDSGTLSNVLAKRRHFSLEKLEQILGLLGYRLSFTPAEAGSNGAMMAASNPPRPM